MLDCPLTPWVAGTGGGRVQSGALYALRVMINTRQSKYKAVSPQHQNQLIPTTTSLLQHCVGLCVTCL